MKKNKVHKVIVKKLWNKYDFNWNNLNTDVNILIGINGSGKTTLFNIIDAVLTADVKKLKSYKVDVELTIDDTVINYNPKMKLTELATQLVGVNYQKISTFDIPNSSKKRTNKEYSQLYNELHTLVYEIGSSNRSFSDYRLKATNFPEQADKINKRIQAFYKTVDHLFYKTEKVIQIDPMTNHMIFIDNGEVIPLYKLSSGEKQLMFILLKVFLMEEEPYILLMDEPEISLHIDWQYKLFQQIQTLNPNCQIITSTHSPSLFGDGWGDKLFFVEDLVTSC